MKKICGYKIKVYQVNKDFKYQAMIYNKLNSEWEYIKVFGNTEKECYSNCSVIFDKVLLGELELSSVFID